MHDRRITLLAGNAGRGRCRDCGRSVIWRTSAPHGKSMPFDSEPLVLSRHENPDTGVHFEIVSPENLHFATCPLRPKRKARPQKARVRSWLLR